MCVAATCRRFRRNARLSKRDRRFAATRFRAMITGSMATMKAKAKGKVKRK